MVFCVGVGEQVVAEAQFLEEVEKAVVVVAKCFFHSLAQFFGFNGDGGAVAV